MRLNIAEAADMFGVSRPTITAWTNDGMPAAELGSKGKPWVYDSTAIIEWWAENKFRRRSKPNPQNPFDEGGDAPESFEEAERRKMVANADKAELELAKAAGRVVEVDDVSFVIAEMHVKVRTRLLAIGNKVRVRVATMFGGDKAAEEQVVSIVEEVVTDAIAEIRDNPFEDGEEKTGGDDS